MDKTTFLIVGGAGYIGSHAARAAAKAGHRVVILDDLSLGHARAAGQGELIIGDMGDRRVLDEVFASRGIGCVMHFAALSLIGPSMADPLATYAHNLSKSVTLLQAMRDHGVNRFILSSTAAVYGDPESTPIRETDPCRPINPYGRSKLYLEGILADCRAAWGLDYACLRYFNAAGADRAGDLGEDHQPETHLIPLVLKAALGQGEGLSILGTDYDTRDGTCIRDFVHVTDLAEAHLLAAGFLAQGGGELICNLGNATGCSVREVIDTARRVTGLEIPVRETDRRPGDPARLTADPSLARRSLGWRPRYPDLESIMESAWRWHRDHPRGFDDRQEQDSESPGRLNVTIR